MTYSITYMIEAFKRHSEEGKASDKKRIEEFTKNYPGEELPEHFISDFSLCDALHSICVEIDKLKKSR